MSRKVWMILIIGNWILPAWGQFTPGGQDFPDNYASEPQGEYDIGPDTADIFYFFADNPGEELAFSDSLLNNFLHQLDPVRQRDLDYANLGNIGSAYRPIVYEPRFRKGFDMGQHQFDLYQTPATDLAFYRIDRAFSDLAFYQRGEQADAFLRAKFSRNFSEGLNFSIQYDRISMLGTRNQYPNQRTRNTAFATGFWYHSPGGRYDGFLSLAWNAIEQENNGGLITGPGETDGLSSPTSASVFLETSRTIHRNRGISYTQYFTFGKKDEAPAPAGPPVRRLAPGFQPDSLARPPLQEAVPDSLKGFSRDSLAPPPPPETSRPAPDRRRYTLAHRIYYEGGFYKFFDDNVDNEQAAMYYGDFLVDTRGLRFFAEHQQLENTFRLRTFKPRPGDGGKARQQRDLLEVGLMHRISGVDLEIRDSTINNLFLQGRFNFQPGERLRIETYGHFGIFDNAGDYRLYGELFFSLGKFGQLTATFNNQLYEPSLMQQYFVISQRPIWSNDFGKTLETNLTATYALPQWQLEITGGYHLLNNYVYFDSLAIPQQTATPISIAQLIVKKNFTAGNFHLDNILAFQASSEAFIRVPDIFFKHSIYYQGRWFGVLNVRFGFDLRMMTTYQPYYYHPLVGQFILRDFTANLYPSIDGVFSMRVTRFRAFFKWENMTTLFIPADEELFYLNARYPMQTGAGLRFGIRWRFVD